MTRPSPPSSPSCDAASRSRRQASLPPSSATPKTGISSGIGGITLMIPCTALEPYRTLPGPAQDLDRGRLLEVHLEELVDVAGADRPDRDAVLEHQHRAAGAGARQHRRAQRRERFLAAAALDHRSRGAVDELRRVRRADELRRRPPRCASRCPGRTRARRDCASRSRSPRRASRRMREARAGMPPARDSGAFWRSHSSGSL